MKRHLRTGLVAWVAAIGSVAAIVWANGAFLDPPALFHLSDEGYIQALAVRMLDGQLLPYVDGVGHRGPLLYWIAALGAWLCGETSWLGLRLLAFAAMLLTTLFTFLAARAAERPFAGAVAALSVALVGLVVMGPADGMAYNGEYLLNVFAMGGLWCITIGLGARSAGPRLGFVALAGICASLAALSKQNGAVMVPALGTWVLAAALARRSVPTKRRWVLVAVFAAGALVPALLLALRYAVAGELATLRYYLLEYNLGVYNETLTDVQKRALFIHWVTSQSVLFVCGAALVLWGLRKPLIGPVRGLFARYDQAGFSSTVALGALLGLGSCNTTLRGFWHYYVQVVPWFGLLGGMILDEAMTRAAGGRRQAALQRLIIVVPVLAWVVVGWGLKKEAYHHAQATIRDKTVSVCAAIQQRTPPGAPLFVWGFRPDLYTWCKRKPASRFVYTTFVAGFVPWVAHMTKADEDRFAVPGSREQLLADLEHAAPPVIIDAAASLGGRSIMRYERLAAYVERHYCPGGSRGDLPFLLRRDESGSCPPAL